MLWRSGVILLVFAAAWLELGTQPASAQILIWNLPQKDGAWVRFEGTHRQTRARPKNAGDEVLEWRSELSISSVGSEQASYAGQNVKCRWVEFKTVTKPPDLEQQPGPGGTLVYKVLFPENEITGQIVEDEDIPVTYLPIVKGYRRVGQRPAEPLTEKALAIYPTIAPLTYYANLKPDGEAPVDLPVAFLNKPLSTRLFKGSRVLVGRSDRSANTALLWRTESVPFGLAKFQVTITREEKDADASHDAFRRVSLTEIEMTAVAVGNDARSDLADQK
ncbi:MAG: hypothetical protein ACT4QC_10895 [Planctomycetaceae bacterium]